MASPAKYSAERVVLTAAAAVLLLLGAAVLLLVMVPMMMVNPPVPPEGPVARLYALFVLSTGCWVVSLWLAIRWFQRARVHSLGVIFFAVLWLIFLLPLLSGGGQGWRETWLGLRP
jgi:hypothetical protein